MKCSHIRTLCLFAGSVCLAFFVRGTGAAGAEYVGQFDPVLIANVEDHERVVFKEVSPDKIKGQSAMPGNAHLAAARIMDPRTRNYSLLSLLVEEPGEAPVIFVDLNGDNGFSDDEKLTLKRTEADNPYLWNATAELKLKEGLFTVCPIFLQYFKSVKVDKMGPEDRLITQSTEVMARGQVDLQGKKVFVQYEYDAGRKKIDAMNGALGIDIDGDGQVDMGDMSPETANADEESVIFRVGNMYVSTKKADISKNQIVMREHEAKEYKRVEVYMNREFPEFSFTDFDGKKRKFSEFRGKYVLLDIWGFWCGPCRQELPYIREAHRRFQGRNLAVIGLNTDPDFTVDSMKKSMNDNGMNWTNAQFTSITDFLRVNLRVTSFPTTFLISPEGKVLSIGRTDRGEPDLRGRDLLTTLDEILPGI
jgi:thiol-disulfide isomerase/thioredoxin